MDRKQSLIRRATSRRQKEAMIDQFSDPQAAEGSELLDWRRIRRAAATRKLERPAR